MEEAKVSKFRILQAKIIILYCRKSTDLHHWLFLTKEKIKKKIRNILTILFPDNQQIDYSTPSRCVKEERKVSKLRILKAKLIMLYCRKSIDFGIWRCLTKRRIVYALTGKQID